MPTPEVKEDFIAYAQEGFWGSKREGPHPVITVDMYPQAYALGSILEKKLYTHLGDGPRQSDVKKELGQLVKCKTKTPEGLSYKWFTSPLY